MAKRQTRKSVSLSKNAFERLRAFAEVRSESMSSVVEAAVAAFMENPPEPKHGDYCTWCHAYGHVVVACPKRHVGQRKTGDDGQRPHVVVTAATPAPPPSLEPVRLPAQLTEPTLHKRKGLRHDKPAAIARIGLCAICTNTRPVQRTQFDVNGPLYDVCQSCNDGSLVERDHLFGGSARAGAGEGNQRVRARSLGGGR